MTSTKSAGLNWVGFNFQWIFSWAPGRRPEPVDLRALDFMAKHGFNFARLACDYRFWTPTDDYAAFDPAMLDTIETYFVACRERGIHFSLNMHRVPGYCINRPEIERHNLWTDAEAQDGLATQWRTFAERFKGVPGDELSFDLINEPSDEGERGMSRLVHERIIRRVVAEIREVDPGRPIVIDGLAGGHLAMPELADLGVIHSGRGYQPMPVSHHGANWWSGWKGHDPIYPGGDWDGHEWNREVLHEFYRPWREVAAKGVQVHIGEFGCYNQTPNDVALRWFTDLISLYREYGWGWSLWGFEGAFGVVDHGRPGARLEEMDGYLADRELFELLRP